MNTLVPSPGPILLPVYHPGPLMRACSMTKLKSAAFDPAAFLAHAGLGRRIVQIKAKHAFFSQGGAADCVFYLQTGRAKLTVVAENGKEATITMLNAGEFVGEESIAGPVGLRMATATAITACVALKIERNEMIRVLHEEHALSGVFMKFLLDKSMRTQADLVDQLFNSSEKRLARILLLLSLIHISEPTRQAEISYAVFCLKNNTQAI